MPSVAALEYRLKKGQFTFLPAGGSGSLLIPNEAGYLIEGLSGDAGESTQSFGFWPNDNHDTVNVAHTTLCMSDRADYLNASSADESRCDRADDYTGFATFQRAECRAKISGLTPGVPTTVVFHYYYDPDGSGYVHDGFFDQAATVVGDADGNAFTPWVSGGFSLPFGEAADAFFGSPLTKTKLKSVDFTADPPPGPP